MTPPSRRHRRRFVALVASLGLLLTACAQRAPQDSLDPEGPIAERIHELFVPVFWVAVVIFVLVQGALIYAIVRFRRRKETADYIPPQLHGNTRLEIAWTILPAAILAVVAVPTVSTVIDLAEAPPAEERLEVGVFGVQWWWEYEYDNGVVTANELHIPVDTPVMLTMTSRDVIHSYWAPKLAGKRDVVPGRVHTLTLIADEPGVYLGQCAEFCGASHANMRLRVVAQPADEFDAWLEDQAEPAREPAPASLAAEGQELFTTYCTSCHSVRGISELPRDERGEGVPWAPDLTHLASRETFAAGLFDVDAPNLARWLRDPPAVKDGALMPDLGLTEEQIDALVAYLLSLT